MDEDGLSDKIARACVDAKVHPWMQLDGGLPEGCPIPELQVYSAQCFGPTERDPMESWRIVVMLEQQIGSMDYWVPMTIHGPHVWEWAPRGPGPGWTASFNAETRHHQAAYQDLVDWCAEGWWPTLEALWEDLPWQYRDYSSYWRSHSDCHRCACTEIILFNDIQLPCPRCLTTPVHTRRGYGGLVWVPAHTPERVAHAEKGKRWRYHHEGYIVMDVLGSREMLAEWGPEHETLHVGLRRHEAVEQEGWTFNWNPVPPGWGDHDVDAEKAFVARAPRPGPLHRLHRRIASWFDSPLVEG